MEKIIKKANSLIKRFKTRDPFEIADNLNIDVKYGDFKELKGFYRYMYRNRFIVINSNLNKIEQNITCSHEIGHDQLHRNQAKLGFMKDYSFYNAKNIFEREANLFSAQLLISDKDFIECADAYRTYSQVASVLNVHEELAIIKGIILHNQGYKLNIPYVPNSAYLGKK